MTVAEGGGKRAVARKFQDVYVPSLKANYLVWPAVQIINFRLMPIQFQIVSSHPFCIAGVHTDVVCSPLCLRLVLRGPRTSP
jgi:hypothetical protein